MIDYLEELLNEIENIRVGNPSISRYLDLYKSILKIMARHRDRLIEDNKRIQMETHIRGLVDKLLEADKPLIRLIPIHRLSLHGYIDMFIDILREIPIWAPEYGGHVDRILSRMESDEMDVEALFKGFLVDGGLKSIDNQVEAMILYFALSMACRPLVGSLTEYIDRFLRDRWWRGWCPVCGRKPVVGRIRRGDKKRYMVCPLCGLEFLVDLFYCPNCENVEPTRFIFLDFEDFPEYSIHVCEECRHYIKVIDENRVRDRIPRGLEDILTIPLDIIAMDEGYRREWILI